jgi:cytochrome c oxidase assembly protein subunit 11
MSSKRKLIFLLTGIALSMFAFGFILVPIYNVFCKATGLNGKTDGPTSISATEIIDKSRWVTVQFLATTNANLSWDFYPVIKTVKLHPGEITRVAYFARNNASRDMTVQAIPSVTPGLAARYLKKTECFCFTQQTFKSHEAEEMPILFHLDTTLPKEITTITLAYTLFDAGKFAKNKSIVQGKINW